ncbi:metalloregulator ArsR/SmtB family transcription factor [Magnetococcales bacterium HHB-1]
MLTPETLCKTLSDSTRFRCLLLLLKIPEICVCELTYALNAPQPKISRHLATLRKSQILLDRKEGQWTYYALHPNLPGWAIKLIHAAMEGAETLLVHQEDYQRLSMMPNRPQRFITTNKPAPQAEPMFNTFYPAHQV